MITFKQFLGEKAMNPGVFTDTIERLSGSAKMGFELEMWVPEESDLLIIKDEDSSLGDFTKTAKEAQESLEDFIGYDVKIDGDTSKYWSVTADQSIQEGGVGIGIEVVSPPEPVEDSMANLKMMFRWMTKHEVVTNSTTGLHLNLSIPGLKEKLDPLKLILFMGESHVLASYERKFNSYATEHGADLMAAISRTGRLPKDADSLKKIATDALKREKYKTVNLSKLENGYLEFRTAGNADYHKKFNQVTADVGRFLTILELACDPDAEKKEYMKKLTKLFNTGKDAQRQKPARGSFAKPGSLEKLVGEANINRLKKNIEDGDMSAAQKTLIHTMGLAGASIRAGEIELANISVKNIAEFKVLFSKVAKEVDGLLDKLRQDEDERDDINAFAKAFNLK